SLEPEPAPVVPLPGWDPADDVTPQDQEAAERAGAAAKGEARRESRKRLIAACTALTVFTASATAITLLLKRPDKGTAHTDAPAPAHWPPRGPARRREARAAGAGAAPGKGEEGGGNRPAPGEGTKPAPPGPGFRGGAKAPRREDPPPQGIGWHRTR